MMSDDLNRLLALANLGLPPIPPFLISGHVIQDGPLWRIADFQGQFRESEVAGAIEIDLGEQRPFVTADLESSRLLVDDLMVAGDKAEAIEEQIDEAPPHAETGADDEAIISAAGINFEALPEVDADISFEGVYVDFAEFRFDGLSFDLKVRDRVAVLDASGEGQFRNGPLTFEAHAGTEESLENREARYPIDLRIDTKKTRVAVSGTVAEPGRTAGLQVDVALEGPDLDRVGEILQLNLPTTPPFKLRSGLTHDNDRWPLTGLAGTIGDSDLEGDATIVLGGERPSLEAELASKKLDFDDLGLLVGAPAADGETLSPEQRRQAATAAAEQGVLPDEPFDVPELRAMDAKVRYRAERVQAQKLPLEGVALDLTLEDGRLALEPLRFDLAGGQLDSVVRLDGRGEVLAGDLQLDIRQVRLNRLLSGFDIEIQDIEMEREGVGTFGGRAELAVRGDSIQDIAGSADGTVAIIMDGGQINALIVEAIGLDIGEAVALLLTGDEEAQSEMVPIQCFIGRFDVQGGIMRTKALVLETSDSTITGSGRIELGEETLALQFLAHPKDPSILTASTPVRIEGTFANPKIDLISEKLEEKSLAALALGVVMPVIGAILPFFEAGETEDSNCARLIADAEAAMPAASPSTDVN
jgi:AsmA family protein